MILKDKSQKEREQIKLKMFFDKDRWERLLNIDFKHSLASLSVSNIKQSSSSDKSIGSCGKPIDFLKIV